MSPKAFRSVRTRIIASYLLLLGLGTLISVFVIRELLLGQLDDRVRADLQQEVEEFRRLAGEGVDPTTGRPFGRDIPRLFTVFLQRNVPGDDEELLTVPRRGRVRYRYSEREEEVLVGGRTELIDGWRRLDRVESGEVDTEAGPARYVAVPVIRDGQTLGTFVVSTFTAAERGEVGESVRIVASVAGSVLIIGTLLALFSAGRVLAPLRSLRDTIRSIEATDLTRRIDFEGGDEIAELAGTFNDMLDRLEQAFSSQRHFIRDAGHELRTPLTIVRGHLELLADEPERLEETLALVTDELDRMSRFVDDLLLLAKLERPDFLQLRTISVDELTRDLLANAEQLATRQWTLDGTSPRLIVADPQRLTQAMMSLADNAARHTDEGDAIAIGSSVNGDWASLWVSDSGPGVASEDQERIFTRLQRGRRESEGTGLGLAIVRAIAEAHGGRIELQSRPGKGARFTVVVPVDAEEFIRRAGAREAGS
jgi:signal transduction histidine kinase